MTYSIDSNLWREADLLCKNDTFTLFQLFQLLAEMIIIVFMDHKPGNYWSNWILEAENLPLFRFIVSRNPKTVTKHVK